MIASFRSGSDALVKFSLYDASGEPLVASALQYRVTDQEGVERVALTALPNVEGAESADVIVQAVINALAADATRELRTVELHVTTPGGVIVLTSHYFIDSGATLTVMGNSFQTLAQALMRSAEIANIAAWDSASDSEKIRALSEAYRALGKLSYRYDRSASQSQLRDKVWLPSSILDLSLAEFQALDPKFRTALCIAQVIEADALLGGSDVSNLRREGLMSATVGEVSQMFRPGKPLILPVARRTLQALAGFVTWTMGAGR